MKENPKTLQELLTTKCENPDCHDGWISVPFEDTTLARECECMNVKRNIWSIKRSGIEKVIDRNRFSTFKTDEPWQKGLAQSAMAYTDEVMAGAAKWFMICGQVGSGKTHICTAIMRELLYEGVSARYVMWREIAMELKRSQHDEETHDQIFGSLMRPRVLYIDDFLKGNITDSDKNFAYDIVNGRYVRDLPMIISSEKTYEEIMDVDPSIGSRIYEKTKGYYSVIRRDGKKNIRMRGEAR